MIKDLQELRDLYFEKYGKTIEEALDECESIFDLIYDIKTEFWGDAEC